MRRRMNIYITTGKKNLKYAYVAIKSLFVNNQAQEIYLYVVSEDLELADMEPELALAKQYGHHIVILHFDEKAAGKYIEIADTYHWPIGTMSSYWLFHELLPQEVDRIMVIESDTVVVGDLSDIYYMDFDDAYVICPGKEHKPANHRNFMDKIGGDTLTFVLSMYNVPKIRRDFTLQDILKTDERVKASAGYSQMEFTFGLLFKGKIKYVPGSVSCIDENERYVQELGYDYLVKCEKTAKIIHFSSYSDYSKPWNPVRIMPGYSIWWDYAKDSPYFKEYFEQQWEIYDKTLQKRKEEQKNLSYRNILICVLVLFMLFSLCTIYVITGQLIWVAALIGEGILALTLSVGIRRLGILYWQMKERRK